MQAGLRLNLNGPLAAFRCTNSDAVVSEIDAVLGSPLPPNAPVTFDSGGVWRVLAGARELRFDCLVDGRIYKSASFERDLAKGTIAVDPAIKGIDADPLEYPLDEVILMHLLARHGGVEVHAMGLRDEDRGLLFVGHSGAGKSTIGGLYVRSRPRAVVLSDDRIIVRRTGGAAQLRMFGTPWHGEASLCDPGSAPLERVFILRQASHNGVRRLAPAAAAAELLSRCFYPVYDADAIGQAADFVARIVGDVPVFELSFRRDEGAVEAALSC